VHYSSSLALREPAAPHVKLGMLHALDYEFAAAITEYEKAETLDSHLAIAFYNNSVASGEMYKFDEQGQKLERAKAIDRSGIERLAANPPLQKIAIYNPPLEQAWDVATSLARKGTAKSVFGTYAYFDPQTSAVNT